MAKALARLRHITGSAKERDLPGRVSPAPCLVSPSLDFGQERIPAVGRGLDDNPDLARGGRREGHRALDQLVTGDRGKRYPGRTVPGLHVECGDAALGESHRVVGFDRAGVVVLYAVDDDVIDR